MKPPNSAFVAGVRDTVAALIGIAALAIVTGTTAIEVGFSEVQAIAMSVIVFAGASQLTVIDLLENGRPVLVVVVTAILINIRFLVFGASIAPYFARETTGWRWLIAYLLVDVPYALSMAAFDERNEVERRSYYLGAAIPVWVVWVCGTAVGVMLGSIVPTELRLEAVIPLIFIAILVSVVEDVASLVAAGVGGIAVVLAGGLPFESGLIVAIVIGIAAGVGVERFGRGFR